MTDERLRERDAAARRQARREFSIPVVLEAGAGTGKTATLVARVLCWCLGAGWELAREALRQGSIEARPDQIAGRTLDRVLAITFTEKATVEMAERIADDLSAFARGQRPAYFEAGDFDVDPEEASRRARSLGLQLDRLRVSTIHGFCHRTLATHAIRAGLHPEFRVDESGDATAGLMDEVLAEFVARSYGDPGDDDAVACLAAAIGPAELREALELLVANGVTAEYFDRDVFSDDSVVDRAQQMKETLLAFVALIE
ncbi:MAG: UvrD-helicase domain-containing protein, partial [Planctomycetes bacterium]|nr:UvrD-helicase domain-containing protein [Planctomycetota bacterium]